MSFKGGYLIINLKGGGKAYENGIYDAVESNYDKMIVLSGITINGNIYPDITVNLERKGTAYFAYVYGKKITISDDNTITLGQYDEDTTYVYLDAPSTSFNPGQPTQNLPGINDALNYAYEQGKTLLLRNVSHSVDGARDAGNVEIKPKQKSYVPMYTNYTSGTLTVYYLSVADDDNVTCGSYGVTVLS